MFFQGRHCSWWPVSGEIAGLTAGKVSFYRESNCTSAANSGSIRILSSKARRNATPLPPMKFGSENRKLWNPYTIIWMVNQTMKWSHVWKCQGRSQKMFQNLVVGQQNEDMTMLWIASIPKTCPNDQVSRLAGSYSVSGSSQPAIFTAQIHLSDDEGWRGMKHCWIALTSSMEHNGRLWKV